MIALARHSLRLLLCLAIGLVLQVHAATAQDIQGEWQMDGAATWATMKESPQFAAMPPEQLKMMETMIMGEMSKMTTVVTADTLTHTKPDGKTESRNYKITKIDGDVVTTESTNEAGAVETTNILVKGDTLSISSPQQPGMSLVMKRKAAAAK